MTDQFAAAGDVDVDPVEGALSLLVMAARVSPPLREAVATVETALREARSSLNAIAAAQYTEVERIWPTPLDQDPALRQLAALTEEIGEVARAVLKRSHAARSTAGVHKGRTVEEWTAEVHVEIGQALGVLLGLGHLEAVDLDRVVANTIYALRVRSSIIDPGATGG